MKSTGSKTPVKVMGDVSDVVMGNGFMAVLKKDGVLISNTQEILPMPVIMGNTQYPDQPPVSQKAVLLDALDLAEKAGSARAVNIVLLGVLARFIDWPQEKWESAIAACVPGKTLETNLKAFRAGLKE